MSPETETFSNDQGTSYEALLRTFCPLETTATQTPAPSGPLGPAPSSHCPPSQSCQSQCTVPPAQSNPPLARLKLCLLNTRSLSNKALLLADFIVDRNLDILCLTETWQQPNDFSHLNEAVPLGFSFISKPCATGRGGGLALLHRDHIKVTAVTVPHHSF